MKIVLSKEPVGISRLLMKESALPTYNVALSLVIAIDTGFGEFRWVLPMLFLRILKVLVLTSSINPVLAGLEPFWIYATEPFELKSTWFGLPPVLIKASGRPKVTRLV